MWQVVMDEIVCDCLKPLKPPVRLYEHKDCNTEQEKDRYNELIFHYDKAEIAMKVIRLENEEKTD